jgi:hypothetical protein
MFVLVSLQEAADELQGLCPVNADPLALSPDGLPNLQVLVTPPTVS